MPEGADTRTLRTVLTPVGSYTAVKVLLGASTPLAATLTHTHPTSVSQWLVGGASEAACYALICARFTCSQTQGSLINPHTQRSLPQVTPHKPGWSPSA
jgi:hypothetical protein